MAKVGSHVRVEGLDEALTQMLDNYSHDVLEGLDAASYRAVERLAKITRATAPVGARGKFRSSIAIQEIYKTRGKFAGRTYVWYVKPPNHRLTHLLVHGHAAKDGGRVPGNPFLHNALDQVIPKYMEEVEDALKW